MSACTAANVTQLQHALDEIYRQHSQSVQQDYQANFHLLDVDMSGLPCGPKAAFARHRLLCRALAPPRAASGPRAGHPV
jgi:hypothetical protein